MTERRLDHMEHALPPKAATLLWVHEAHRFDSLTEYVEWLLDRPASDAPFARVPTQARAAARLAMRGKPLEAVVDAEHQAVRDALFLLELVINIEIAAFKTIQMQRLRYLALFWEWRAMSAEVLLGPDDSGPGGSLRQRCRAWCQSVRSLVAGLYVAEEARVQLQTQYFDGHSVLFPSTAATWDALLESAESLHAVTDDLTRLVEHRRPVGAPEPVSQLPAPDLADLRSFADASAATDASDLADEARVTSLEIVLDEPGAIALVERRLRRSASTG